MDIFKLHILLSHRQNRSAMGQGFLDQSQMTDNRALKIFGRSNLFSANDIALHVTPNPLVRVEFRRIRPQEEKPKTIFDRFDKPRHRLRFVRRMTVCNQENHTSSVMEKSFDKFYELKRTHSSLDDHEPKFERRGFDLCQDFESGDGSTSIWKRIWSPWRRISWFPWPLRFRPTLPGRPLPV